MKTPLISVNHIAKKFTLGQRQPYYSLRDSIVRAFSRQKKKGCEFWALRDISFDVEQGDILGIIGRNGAGKSTLLKILSRITPPTRGSITMRGNVASLLEVGTGFNMELTGKENIFLNGAILGMKTKEIQKKFDDIVSFAQVEKFLDTPVKRYSSGMYVRLAFAVAAHREADILIVDEVLAVGDTDFQKKCLQKMKNVTQQGRTVLYVSHNMSSIQQLCSKAMFLENGSIKQFGRTDDVIESYISTGTSDCVEWRITDENGLGDAYFTHISIQDFQGNGLAHVTTASAIMVCVEFTVKKIHSDMQLSMALLSDFGEVIFSSSLTDSGADFPKNPGEYEACFQLPAEIFFPRYYAIRTVLWTPRNGAFDSKEVLNFLPQEVASLHNSTPGGRMGVIALRCNSYLKDKG